MSHLLFHCAPLSPLISDNIFNCNHKECVIVRLLADCQLVFTQKLNFWYAYHKRCLNRALGVKNDCTVFLVWITWTLSAVFVVSFMYQFLLAKNSLFCCYPIYFSYIPMELAVFIDLFLFDSETYYFWLYSWQSLLLDVMFWSIVNYQNEFWFIKLITTPILVVAKTMYKILQFLYRLFCKTILSTRSNS